MVPLIATLLSAVIFLGSPALDAPDSLATDDSSEVEEKVPGPERDYRAWTNRMRSRPIAGPAANAMVDPGILIVPDTSLLLAMPVLRADTVDDAFVFDPNPGPRDYRGSVPRELPHGNRTE